MSGSISLKIAPGEAADLTTVEERVGKSKTSFYAAMRILPKARREAMFAIYAFCREVDDIADEPGSVDGKRQALDLWRDEISLLYKGLPARQPVARTLAGPIRDFGLLRQDFEAVIDGMQMDAETAIQAPSLAVLDLYCARVASAVGRLSVRIFGPWELAADSVADELGRALQLTNILRDLDEDAARGRLYLPRELLERHGIACLEPDAVLAAPTLPAVCDDLAVLAENHYAKAAAAMRLCSRRTMRPARMMGGVYRVILHRLRRRGWAAPRLPVRLSRLAKLSIALRQAF